jgi:hypothetical protein
MSTLSRLHIETHKGNAYEVGNIFTNIANNGVADLLVTVPVDKTLHMAVTAQVEVRSKVSIIEAPATATHGTSITPRNLNRIYDDASTAIWSHTPTAITGGLELIPQLIPSGAKDKGGGLAGTFIEHNLSPAYDKPTDITTTRDYIVRVQNVSGAVADYVGIYILYYGVPFSGN